MMSEIVPGIATMLSEFSELRQKAGLSIAGAAEKLGYNERTVYRWENGETAPRKAALETLRLIAPVAGAKTLSVGSFTFVDLFAGIGGLRKGFESVGGSCLYTSEWNAFSRATYRANFECEHEPAGDITKIAASEIPDHDVLLAGFPCQPFSIAGVSKKNALGRPHGFRCEAQGTLFFDVARILEYHRPKAFLLENVKNLVTHDQRRTFDVILRTLEHELGYHVKTRVIDGRGFVPQHRERIFIVGFRNSDGFSLDDLHVPDASEGPKLRSILHPEDGSESPEAPYTEGDNGRVADRYTLSRHLWDYLQAYAARHREKGNGFGFGLVGPDDVARTLSARYYKDGSEVLVRQNRNRPPRRLTPRECARLMGFEKPGGPRFNIPVSDTQAYKQFGNAVIVPVVEAVAMHMRPWILGEAVQPELFPRTPEIRAVA
jgi:DNA (cytosine-5)-methyltransferase 1